MNTFSSPTNIEPRWNPYLKAIGFLMPAFFFWVFAEVSVFPKLQMISRQSHSTGSDVQWLMDFLSFLMQNDGLLCGAVLAVLVLLELCFRVWARYRRAALGSWFFC